MLHFQDFRESEGHYSFNTPWKMLNYYVFPYINQLMHDSPSLLPKSFKNFWEGLGGLCPSNLDEQQENEGLWSGELRTIWW